jgi:esterase/lipase
MRRRNIGILATLGVMLGAIVYATTPGALVNAAAVPALPEDIDAFIVSSEQRAAESHPLIPDTDKRIVWREPGQRTRYAIVHLHGFSATRQETAPLAELVAEGLGANLFEARLTGHGRAKMGLHEVTAEDWIDDAAEALAIGSRLGDKVIVMGTSTGATLALAMAGHEAAGDVSHLVLLSPNIRPRNELQGRYWTTSYPTDAAIEMMRLVDFVDTRLDTPLGAELLVLMSPDDQVVSPEAIREAFGRIDADHKELHEINDSLGPWNHILAGDILAPESTPRVVEIITEFIRAGGSPELRSAPLSKTSPQDQPTN